VVEGNIVKDIIDSEEAVANFSGAQFEGISDTLEKAKPAEALAVVNAKASLLTEGKIRSHLIHSLKETRSGDSVLMGNGTIPTGNSTIQRLC